MSNLLGNDEVISGGQSDRHPCAGESGHSLLLWITSKIIKGTTRRREESSGDEKYRESSGDDLSVAECEVSARIGSQHKGKEEGSKAHSEYEGC